MASTTEQEEQRPISWSSAPSESSPSKIFERPNMIVSIWKENGWVDSGRGKLRLWSKVVDSSETSWLSMISIGTMREILTLHEYHGDKIDNRVLLNQNNIKLAVLDPQPYDGGVLLTTFPAGKTFLFKQAGGPDDQIETASIAIISDLIGRCKTSETFRQRHGLQPTEDVEPPIRPAEAYDEDDDDNENHAAASTAGDTDRRDEAVSAPAEANEKPNAPELEATKEAADRSSDATEADERKE